MNKNRRPQAPKVRNKAYAVAMQDLRRGSRTSPVPSGKTYSRPKAGARNREW